MKTIQHIPILIILFFSISAFGQFNTLNYVTEETSEFVIQDNKDSIVSNKEVKKKRKFRLFGGKNRKLKKELDSLKGVISEMKNNYTSKLDDVHLKDSILYYLKLNINQPQKKQLKKLDLIKEKLNKFHFPIKGELKITSNFGVRTCPFEKKSKMHYGIDLRADYVNVYSVLNGIISEVGYDNKSGNYIKVMHSNSYETIYTHLSHIYYKKGENVKAGYVIGRSGNSGRSTAPHLHFAVKEKGKYINPVRFLNNIIKINNLIASIL